MSTELSRKGYGETTKGMITVIAFGGSPDPAGRPTDVSYQVRHGAHTVATFDSDKDADIFAKALAKSA